MKTIANWLVVTIAIAAAMIAFRIDISAARFFRSDVVVRDSFASVSEPPYYDPSPYSLWLPSDLFVWDSVRTGHLPLWDRMQGGGYSPVLTLYNGVFHPLRWIVAIAPRDLAPSVLIVLALMTSLSGMWLVLRIENRSSRLGAAVGAVVFTFCSPVVANLHFSGDLLPLVHTPWIVFFAQRTARARSIGSFVGLVASIALVLLAGHPLFALTAGLAALGFVLAEAFEARSPRPLVVLGVATASALFVGAFAFVPPFASLSDLWFYKTQTHQGSVYALFDPIERWFGAIASILVDRRSPASSVDDTAFWLYVGIPATVLAGAGVIDALQRTRDRVIAGVLLCFFMLSVPGPWMADLAATKPLTYMNRSYFAGGMAFAGAVLAAGGFEFLRRRNRVTRAVAFACAAAVTVVYLERAYEVLQPHRWSPVVQGDVVALLQAERSSRIIGSLGQTHLPNSSRVTGIEDVRESTPIWTVRKHLWWEAVDPNIRRFTFPTFRITDRLDSPLIGDFNIRYVVWSRLGHAGFHNGEGSAPSPGPSGEPMLGRPSVDVLRWRGLVRPRVHFAEQTIAAHDMNDAARLLRENRFPAASTAVVEWGAVGMQPGSPASGSAAVTYPSDSKVVLDVDSASGGLVVLHDTFERGWQARLDGRPAGIVPVNLISRGLVVPAGRHRVEMQYEPPAFRVGLGISAFAFVSLGFAAVWKGRRLRASRGGITPSEPALGEYRA